MLQCKSTVLPSGLRLGRPVRWCTLVIVLCGPLIASIPAGAQSSTTPPVVSGQTKGSPPASGGTTADPAIAKLKDAATPRKSAADCAGGEDLRQRSASASSPSIVYNTNFVPAWSTVDFGIQGTNDSDGYYFALLTDQNKIPNDDSLRRVRARKASPNDDLVVKRLLSAGDTIVSLDVPIDVASGWWWSKRNLYIYQCVSKRPVNVSYTPVYISPFELSWALAVIVLIALYWLVSRAFMYVTEKKLNGWHAVNPIRITASSDNRGSLSAFQVFFFTLIVFSMLVVVLLRTGVLSDLSTTILELLGIAGIGAAAAKGTDNSKNNLDPANLTWLYNKGWYDSPTVVAQTEPSFYDLISNDGSFDVYRFQSFVFTVAVGIALLIGGIAQLASFTIPQNILGILGLSQIVYIAGKVVTANDATRLNAAVTELRDAEAEFRKAALPPGAALGDLQAAIKLAPTAYADYQEKVTGAAKLFKQIIGRTPDQKNLAPSIGA
ncbi:hypothetical protein [Bradyrhizobium sp.]|uniref:hypothetical protein n=1 Tax=Bradyrhizobium sp. TaxID=376 RepID=UPI0025C581A7|nr:hypothetical protein [Bradyrhizobium sp.]